MLASLVLIILPTFAGDNHSLPSPEILFAQFQANKDSFAALKLQWHRTAESTKAWRDFQEAQILALHKKAGDYDSLSAEAQQLSREVQNHQQILSRLSSPRHMVQLYVTDRSNFLVVSAPADWTAARSTKNWLLPETPGKAITTHLDDGLPGCSYVTYGKNAGHGFTQVYLLNRKSVSAIIRAFNYPNEQNFFPPLGVSQKTWGEDNLWHPIDLFFRDGPANFTTARRETINGCDTVLITQQIAISAANSKALGSRRFQVVKAWLDPKRGALPLRIEWSLEDETDGNPSTRKTVGTNPVKILETSEINQVKNGGYYPSKGTIKTFGPAPLAITPNSSTLQIPFSVPEEVITWEAANIEPKLAPDQSFKISIPVGSYYYDEIIQASLQSGYEHQNKAMLPWTFCAAILTCWLLYGIFVCVRRWMRKPTAKSIRLKSS